MKKKIYKKSNRKIYVYNIFEPKESLFINSGARYGNGYRYVSIYYIHNCTNTTYNSIFTYTMKFIKMY